MSSDLEAEIRDALRDRALSVTADGLRRRGEPAHTGRRAVLAAIAAAAVVAALAVGIGVAAWPSSHRNRQVGTAVGTSFVGIVWRLNAVQEGGDGAPSVSRPGVSIVFNRGGAFAADDSVNNYSGRYRVTANRIALSDTIGSAVGTTGRDPVLAEVLSAMSAVMSGRSVGVQATGTRLVLTVSGYTLIFDSAGSAPEPSPVVSSTTPAPGAPQSYVNGSELPS